MQAAKRTPVDLREWAVGLMERDNRKSHLAPQLSPSTQDLLRSNDSPPSLTHTADEWAHSTDEWGAQTPTSGEIPIAGTGLAAFKEPQVPQHGRSPSHNGIIGSRTPSSARPGFPRVNTTNSISKASGYPESAGPVGGSPMSNGPGSAGPMSAGPMSVNSASFSLPVRSGPPSGPLPPPPPRKQTPDELRRDNRRQMPYGLPSNPAYGLQDQQSWR